MTTLTMRRRSGARAIASAKGAPARKSGEERAGVAKQKPRQGDGAKLVRLSDGACRRGAKSSAASRHPNAEPQSWLHSPRGRVPNKSPAAQGSERG